MKFQTRICACCICTYRYSRGWENSATRAEFLRGARPLSLPIARRGICLTALPIYPDLTERYCAVSCLFLCTEVQLTFHPMESPRLDLKQNGYGILRTHTWRAVPQMNQVRWLSDRINDEYPQIVKFIPGKTCVIYTGHAGAAKRTRLI